MLCNLHDWRSRILGSRQTAWPSAAEVLCCPVNCFETRSSAEARTKRNVARSNCIIPHHDASRGILWFFLWIKNATKHHYFSKCSVQALYSPYGLNAASCCSIFCHGSCLCAYLADSAGVAVYQKNPVRQVKHAGKRCSWAMLRNRWVSKHWAARGMHMSTTRAHRGRGKGRLTLSNETSGSRSRDDPHNHW